VFGSRVESKEKSNYCKDGCQHVMVIGDVIYEEGDSNFDSGLGTRYLLLFPFSGIPLIQERL
jgi:hypothetical protein